MFGLRRKYQKQAIFGSPEFLNLAKFGVLNRKQNLRVPRNRKKVGTPG